MKRTLRTSCLLAGPALLATFCWVGPAGGQGAGKVIAKVPAPVAAPLSLTASDGAGLELVSLSAQAVIEDPLAFTELHLVFPNPESRVREGRFRITLPEGAAISRFAMLIGDSWQEGEVVELQAARRAYEDFLHRRQDPALLESEAGNEFSARVFPIPANATKELIVSYSQELVRSDAGYRLPLRGLPKMSKLRVRALLGKAELGAATSSLGGRLARHEVIEVDKHDFAPDRDFEVSPSQRRLGLRSDNLVVARVAPLGPLPPPEKLPGLGSLLVLYDTSASRVLGFQDQLDKVRALCGELGKRGDASLALVAFDQFAEPIYAGKASGFGDGVSKKLLERTALGASNLELALGHVAERAKQGEKWARVLLVTDGVATAGAVGADKLRAQVKALGAAGVQRLDALAVGGIREQSLLASLVTAGLPADGVVIDGDAPLAEQVRRLHAPTRSGLKVEVPGAAWVWPDVLHGAQPGDEVLIYADLPSGKAFSVKVGGVELAARQALPMGARPLVERAAAQARIRRALARRDTLAASDEDLAEALRKQVIELSTKYRVLSPYTALLVLETEADYARFGIERKALADILTVDSNGISVVARRNIGPAIASAPRPPIEPRAVPLKRESEGRRRHVAARSEAASPPALNVAPATPVVEDDAMEAVKDLAVDSAPQPSEAMPPSSPVTPAPAADRAARPKLVSSVSAQKRVGSRRPLSAPSQEVARPSMVREEREPESVAPYEGEMAEVMALLADKKIWPAMVKARAWRARDPGDVLALLALGEAAEASHDTTLASRAYGSLIDLFPGRADLRRYAGQRLERVRDGRALALAVDTFGKAVEQRPDHPAGHRLLGMALVKLGRPSEAFDAIARGLGQRYPDGRFAGAGRILAEDLSLVAAAWVRAQPGQRASIEQRLRERFGQTIDERRPCASF